MINIQAYRRLFRVFWMAAGLFLFSFISLIAQVSVRTQLDTNYMLIGDQMRLHVQVNSNSELKKIEGLIAQIDTSETVEVIGETPWQKQTGGDLKSYTCLLYTSPSPRDQRGSRMPSSA